VAWSTGAHETLRFEDLARDALPCSRDRLLGRAFEKKGEGAHYGMVDVNLHVVSLLSACSLAFAFSFPAFFWEADRGDARAFTISGDPA
jgi:hypothetical protein